MILLPQTIAATIPAIGATENNPDPTVQVKFFTPDSSWTWLVTEFDQDDIFFGLAIGFEAEWGYFSLSEMTNARGPHGLPVERDLYFTPAPMSVVKARGN